MDDTAVEKAQAGRFAPRRPLSGLARLVAATGLAFAGIVAGPLVHRASADVTYCRTCPSSHYGGPSTSGGSGWNSSQNNGN
jgi:hypothetical protein